jgi:hypothetical protein
MKTEARMRTGRNCKRQSGLVSCQRRKNRRCSCQLICFPLFRLLCLSRSRLPHNLELVSA